jgi:hypothetical protein
MRIQTYIEEAVVGIVILAVTLAALGSIVRPAISPLGYAGANIGSFLDLVWLAVSAGLIIYGISKDKPGFIFAPFIFGICWFGASVATRWRLQASIDPKVWSAPLSSEATRSAFS